MKEFFRRAGFYMLGIFSLLYVIFARDFAEMRFYLPFLDFPVFIGELFLFFCLVFSLFVFDFRSIKGWQWGVVFYFACVILKAFWGYYLWGPLAFRHAALLYYPIFIFAGFIFYKKAFLTEPLKIFIAFLILVLCITKYFSGYWVLALWGTAFVLIKSLCHKSTKYFFYAGLLSAVFLSHKEFVLTSRTFITGNIAAAVFLAITLFIIARIRLFYKVVIAGIVFILLAASMFKYSSLTAAGTIIDIKGTINKCKITAAEIEARRPYYVPQELKYVKLFNPEQPSLLDPVNYKRCREDGLADRREREVYLGTVAKCAITRHSDPEAKPKGKNFDADGILRRPVLVHKGVAPRNNKRGISQQSHLQAGARLLAEPKAKNEDDVIAEETLPGAFGTGSNELIIKEEDVKNVCYNTLFRFLIWRDMICEFSRHWFIQRHYFKKNNLKISPQPKGRAIGDAYSNTIFRLFIWRDMICEFSRHWPATILGFSFGKPFRSESIEILYQASGEWERDGWIEPHNSYLNMLYRMGILGFVLIGFLMWQFCHMVKSFVVFRSLPGIVLCSILVNWLVAANFLPILELPYNAIPIWTLWGIALGYLKELKGR